MNDYRTLKLEKRGHIALVTIANPPANTWTSAGLDSLRQLVADLEADQDIYSLVLIGEGEKFFSAGADLNQFKDADPEEAAEAVRRFGEAFETLAAFRGVSIAAINGIAMGGGLEAALACDLRVCEEQVKLGLPEAKVGLLPGAGGTQRLPLAVGSAWAKRMILCGAQVNAETALRLGLVEELVPQGQALSRALELAKQVERQSPMSVALSKQLIDSAPRRPIAINMLLEREAFVELFYTEDQREGISAFIEKRKPEWKNR